MKINKEDLVHALSYIEYGLTVQELTQTEIVFRNGSRLPILDSWFKMSEIFSDLSIRLEKIAIDAKGDTTINFLITRLRNDIEDIENDYSCLFKRSAPILDKHTSVLLEAAYFSTGAIKDAKRYLDKDIFISELHCLNYICAYILTELGSSGSYLDRYFEITTTFCMTKGLISYLSIPGDNQIEYDDIIGINRVLLPRRLDKHICMHSNLLEHIEKKNGYYVCGICKKKFKLLEVSNITGVDFDVIFKQMDSLSSDLLSIGINDRQYFEKRKADLRYINTYLAEYKPKNIFDKTVKLRSISGLNNYLESMKLLVPMPVESLCRVISLMEMTDNVSKIKKIIEKGVELKNSTDGLRK